MSGAPDDLLAAARAYAEAIHHARPEVFAQLCHDRFTMAEVTEQGARQFWDKAGYMARVAARAPFPGAPSWGLMGMDVAGGLMARVHLWVDVPPRRYEDHLGFVRDGGAWKLLFKSFRTLSGPAAV